MIFLLSLTLICSSLLAQDERDFRSVFTGNLDRKKEIKEEIRYKWRVNTPFYYLDLTGDNLDESFGFEKKDGEDWIHFLDLLKRPQKSFRFDPKGGDSRLYKVQFRRISKRTKVLILYYFEGKTQAVDYISTARLYFVTIDDNKLSTLSMYKGPYFLYEKEEHPEHYHRRRFQVGVYDYNGDGVMEIYTKYHKINRVYAYLGNGKWTSK